jgi:hypothetical protein
VRLSSFMILTLETDGGFCDYNRQRGAWFQTCERVFRARIGMLWRWLKNQPMPTIAALYARIPAAE